MMRIDEEGNHGSVFKPFKLKFGINIPEKIFTGDQIKGEVALYDVSTGYRVEDGPEASSRLEIIPLKGDLDASETDDWTAEEFEDNIVRDTEGKKTLLAGSMHIKLQRGIGVMDVKFIHRASEMKPPVFCIGARVIDPVSRDRIKEAKTVCFTLKNYRGKYYEKYPAPSLSDRVSRLKNIRKGGKIDKRLKDNGIETVGDFLIRFLRDPLGLESIVGMVPKKWSDTLKNARECKDKRTYCYADFEQKTAIVFNIMGEVKRLHNPFRMSFALELHKAELLAAAYKHWEEHVKHFDDEHTLEQYLAGLTQSWAPIDFPMQNDYWPSFSHPNIYVDDFPTFDGLELDECFLDSLPDPSSNVEPWNLYGGSMNESYIYQSITDEAAEVAESQDAHNRRPRRRWKTFRYIWKYVKVCERKMRKRCRPCFKKRRVDD